MGYLRGAPLPSGRATWDICAGAYGERKIVVGDRPSPTPDVMMHEVGHAIDDIDSAFGEWVSDSPDFAALFERVEPLLVSAFHRQGGGLGRKGVLRRRLRRDRRAPASGPGGHARRQHAAGARRHAVLQQALRNLGGRPCTSSGSLTAP
ncbi:hypothetical protein ACFSTC_54860 [Nonomuraea ferruginea]